MFSMGVPFLLYNTPPGIYVAAAFVAKMLHVTPLIGLKLCMVTAFCSVPLAGAAVARTFEDEPGDLPKFTALAFSLFSSELIGLEFYFKNGMINPAFALPMFPRRARHVPRSTTSHRSRVSSVSRGGRIFFRDHADDACPLRVHVLRCARRIHDRPRIQITR